jgi:RHS repeat-associated protein
MDKLWKILGAAGCLTVALWPARSHAQVADTEAAVPVHLWTQGTSSNTTSYSLSVSYSWVIFPYATAGGQIDYFGTQEIQYSTTAQSIAIATLSIAGSGFVPSLPNDPVQIPTGSFQISAIQESSFQPILVDCGLVRVVPGKTYTLNLSYADLVSGSGMVNVAPPPGYRVILNGVPANSTALASQVTMRVLPALSSSAAAGYASSISGASINWQVSLGSLLNGDSAGNLQLADTGAENSPANGSSPWAGIFTSAGLSYESASDEVYVYELSGAIRQILAPQVAVDIVSFSTPNAYNQNYYEVRCYGATQASGYSPSTFTGQPYVTYRVMQGATPTALTITREARNITNPTALNVPITRSDTLTLQRTGNWPNFSWSRTDWTQSGQAALATTTVSGTGTAQNRAELVSVADSGGIVAAQLTRRYLPLACGEVLSSETLGSTNPATTSFDYYDDTTQPGSFSFLKDVITPGGGWVAYDYYDTSLADSYQYGRVQFKYQPYGNAPAVPTHDPGQGLVTYYEYSVDPFGFMTRPALVQTSINGTVTSKSATSYSAVSSAGLVTATRNDYSNASNSLVTTTVFYNEAYSDPMERGKTYSVQLPTGVQESYLYEHGTWDGTTGTFTSSGVTSSPGSRITILTGVTTPNAGQAVTTSYNGNSIAPLYLVAGKSTAAVVIRDERALPVRTETWAWSNGVWNLVSFSNSTFDVAGRQISQLNSDGTTLSAVFDGLLKQSDTRSNGLTTNYAYDAMGRVQISTRAASGSISALATKFIYNGVGSIIEQRVGWGQTEQLITDTGYDDSGRIISQTPPGLGASTTAYDVANRIKTVTRPDGGTTIATSNLDGTPASQSGSCLVGQYFSYGTETDGRTYQIVFTGSASSPRWVKAWNDWLGRNTETDHPGFTGQPVVAQTSIYAAGTGLLTETTKTGYASTYFSYDPLGQPFRSGLDVDSNGGLTLGGNDRVTETNQFYEFYNGAWWSRKDSIGYLTQGSSTPTTLSTARTRLTSFPSGVVSDSMNTDAEGNVTETQSSINLATATTTATTTSTGLADPQIDISVLGLATSHTTHDKLTSTTTYDSLLRAQIATDSRGNATTTAYVSGSNLVYTVTDASAAVLVTNNYDSVGRKNWTEDAGGHYTRYAYNFWDQVVEQWGDGAIPLSYTYDAVYGDKLTLSTYRGGAGWDGAVWPTGAGTADTTTWSYDSPSGLQTSKQDPVNPAVTQTYNLRGQTATRTLSRGTVTTYSYDAGTGELLGQTYSDSTPAIGYTYNRQGKMATVTDATGLRTFNYDILRPWRFDSESLSTYFASKVVTRLYDNTAILGRVNGFQLGSSAVLNADLEQDYGFTPDGRFNTLTSSQNAGISSRSFQYGYLPNSALVQSLAVEGAGTFQVNRTFETTRDYLLSAETDWAATNEARFDYTSNALGQRVTRIQSGQAFASYGNSTLRSYGYDSRGELTSAPEYLGTTATTAAQMPSRQDNYAYDNIGNRTSVNRTTNAGLAEAYTVNALNQYVTKENDSLAVSGTADATSNVAVAGSASLAGRQGSYWAAELTVANTSSPWTGPITAYAGKAGAGISGADLIHIIARTGTIPPMTQSFTYDADGNLTADGMWSYTWDGENRLIQMQTSTAAATAGLPNYQINFVYDYLGRRVQKRVINLAASSAEVSARRYVYDGWNLIAEFTAPGGTTFGTLIRSYTWGLDIARSLKDAGGVGALVQIVDQSSGNNYLPGYDGNGNVVVLLNADSGAIAADYEYDPFGQILRSDEQDSAVASQPFRFSTKYSDLETGLYYYGHRYYDPMIGRFINKDPIEEAGGINLYGFVLNDAINHWDYLGNLDGDSDTVYNFSGADDPGGDNGQLIDSSGMEKDTGNIGDGAAGAPDLGANSSGSTAADNSSSPTANNPANPSTTSATAAATDKPVMMDPFNADPNDVTDPNTVYGSYGGAYYWPTYVKNGQPLMMKPVIVDGTKPDDPLGKAIETAGTSVGVLGNNIMLASRAKRWVRLGGKSGRLLEHAGKMLGPVAVGIAIGDIGQNGLNLKNGADLFFGSLGLIPTPVTQGIADLYAVGVTVYDLTNPVVEGPSKGNNNGASGKTSG